MVLHMLRMEPAALSWQNRYCIYEPLVSRFFKLIFLRPGVRRLRSALNERLVGKPMPVAEKNEKRPRGRKTLTSF